MKTLRAAVIGRTGRGDYGHGLDEVWNDLPGVELVAVADDNKTGLAAEARKLKLERSFADYRQMLDEVKPDVVSIGARWLDQHHDIVVACAERGIHMYLEKPLCRTLAEADDMIAACERTHTRCAVAHQTRYSPRIPVVKEMIAGGKIGRVLELRGRGKEDQRGGGEDLWVLGTHVMDLTRLLGGNPSWCFGRVWQGGKSIAKSDVAEGNEGIGPLAGDAVNAMYGMTGSPDGVLRLAPGHVRQTPPLRPANLRLRRHPRADDRLSAERQIPGRSQLVARAERSQVGGGLQRGPGQAGAAKGHQRPCRQPRRGGRPAASDRGKPRAEKQHLRRSRRRGDDRSRL